jgi:hypothetical protein
MATSDYRADSERFAAKLFSHMTLASPEADQLEQLALSNPVFAAGLTKAAQLTDGAWTALWDRFAGDTAAAVALVARPLSPTQIDRVCSARPNAKVTLALLGHNRILSASQLGSLADRAKVSVAKRLTDIIIDGSAALDASNAEVALRLVKIAGLARWVHLVAVGGELFDDAARREVIDALRGSDLRSSTAGWDTQLLLWRHPELLTYSVESARDTWLDVRIAGLPAKLTCEQQACIAGLGEPGEQPTLSIELATRIVERRFVLMALVNNPVCHPDVVRHVATVTELCQQSESLPDIDGLWDTLVGLSSSCARRLHTPYKAEQVTSYETVTDADTLAWLVSRVIASEMRPRPRPFEAFELSHNPHLGQGQARKLAWVFLHSDVQQLFGPKLAQERYEYLAGVAGDLADGLLSWFSTSSEGLPSQVPAPPSVTRLQAGEFPAVAELPLEQLRSAVISGYGRMVRSGEGNMVSLIDWLLVELAERVGGDAGAFATALGLIEILDPDRPLSELLELAGVV